MRTKNLSSAPDVRESIALLEQAHEITQHQIESTNRAITELADNTGSQIRELGRTIEKQSGEWRTEMRSLANEFANSRRTHWPTLLSVFMALALLVGAAYKIVDLQTQVTMSPVVSASAVSVAERTQLREDISSLSNQIFDLKAEQKRQVGKFVEVETQMSKNYDERNIQFAETSRKLIMHENALHSLGATIPEAAQYPYFFPTRTTLVPEPPGQ